MEIEVVEAARQLGLSEPRVRQLIDAGDLRARRAGHMWLVESDDISRLAANRPLPGRPWASVRAWAVLDLLDGETAPWLASSARSQIRHYLRRLDNPTPQLWLTMLRRRRESLYVQAHPAAIKRLMQDGALPTGLMETTNRNFDLVVTEERRPELYVPAERWETLARNLFIMRSHSPNLVVHLPQQVWPFAGRNALPDAALAADLLDSDEDRAVRAGAQHLSLLLTNWQASVQAKRGGHR